MVIAIVDDNDCDFAIKFEDESVKDKVKEYMKAGLSAWYQAAHVDDEDDVEDNEYFTGEDIIGFYDEGYAEPTMELLERFGIEAECIDVEYDNNDCVVNADEVIRY